MYQTARLSIRKFVDQDITPLVDLFSSPTAMRFIGRGKPMTVAETTNWLETQLTLQQSEIRRFAVTLPEANELIGVCGFQKIDQQWDFGYYFRDKYWGHGYAIEAASYLLSHADRIIPNQSFEVFIADANLSSIKLMERCGYQPAKKAIKNGNAGCYYEKQSID